jgi:xanthine dehydrogenase accessory factor
MFDQFLKKTTELVANGESFVTATVVRCEPPTSGKPGDKAIIRGEEVAWGWIGGGCAQPVVIKEAKKALAEGKPKLVRISPSPSNPEEGIVDYTMTCHSGGALDIYLEPVLPKPQILILGRSPVAQFLAQIGSAVGYAVSIVTEDAAEGFADVKMIQSRNFSLEQTRVTPETFVVVSTQGEGDEDALEQALNSGAGYIAFVASKTKAGKLLQYLQDKGMTPEKAQQLRAPAGLNIGAKSPEEIAVSVLAEIIQIRAGAAKTALQPQNDKAIALPIVNTDAKDLVCGMTVDTTKAKYKTEHQGKMFYFCCAGCKKAFETSPQKYLASAAI